MKKWLYSFSCLAIIGALTGCGNNAVGPRAGLHTQNAGYQQPNQNPSSYRANMHHYNNYTQRYDVYNYRNGFTAQGFNQQLAERIARAADSVPGVDHATAIVYGNDCVVGANTRMNTLQQRQVIERQIHSAVRSVAPNCNIRVTTDGSMFTRIQKMDMSIRNGLNGTNNAITSGPTTVPENLANVATDFAALVRDMGRTITAPFR
ncbi:YhcN/YlaJ family sporulation lipoprotein [Brevibacillus sp. H7]|uniref:YhcN/YlaJ family sporulation lipoprotein n=1 Tax=Brevibacillus sp. H7 TaxID=3349138 RepID=UPI0037F3F0F8